MAIVYVGGQVAGDPGATTTAAVAWNLTGGTHTSPQAGDLVIITVVAGTQGRTPNLAVSGYTALTQLNANGTTYDTSLCVSYKFMGATPDANFTPPPSGNNADGRGYVVQCFRGVDTVNPFDVTTQTATGTGTGNPSPASITPTTSGAWVLVNTGGAAATFTTTWTTSGLSNVRSSVGTDTNDGRILGSATAWTSGTFSVSTFTGGDATASNSWAAYTMALRPNAAASTLTENFSAALDTTTKWTSTLDTTSTQSATDGTLNQTCTGTDQFALLKSQAKFSLTGSSIYVKLAQGATNGGANGADAQFFLEATDGTKLAVWQNSNNIITFGYNSTSLSQITYVPATHTWLRFREASGTLYWDHAPATATNPPSSGDWVNQASLALTTFTAGVDDLFVSLNSTTWTGASNGTVKWDGLNTAAGASFSDSITETATVTESTSASFSVGGAVTETATVSDSTDASVTTGNAAISTLTDTFTGGTLDTAKWTTFGTGTGQTVTQNNELILDPNGDNAAINHVGVRSTNQYNLTGSSAYVKLVQRLQTTGDDWGFSETWFGLENTANDEGFGFVLEKDGDLQCRIWYDIGDNFLLSPEPATVTGFTDGTWLRLRHDTASGGTLYWDTAPDSSGSPGTWTNRASVVTSTLSGDINVSALLSNCTVCLRTGFWDNTMSDSFITGPAKFDGFNTSAAPPAYAGTIAETAAVTDAVTASVVFSNASAETATPTEAQTSVFSGAGAVAETATPTHTQTSVFSGAGAVAETATVTHTQSGGTAFASATSDTATVTETVDRTITIPTGALIETATPTEVQTSVFSGAGAVAETATVTHTEDATRINDGALSEVSSVTHAENGVASVPTQEVAETATPVDVPVGLSLFSRSVAETSTATETLSGTSGATSLLAETATVTHTQTGVKPTVADIIDNFNSVSLDTVKWSTSGTVSPGTVSQTNGQLVLAVNSATEGSNAWITSTSRYSLTGNAVYVKCVTAPEHTGVFGFLATMLLQVATNTHAVIEVDANGPTIFFSTVVSEVSTYTLSAGYDPATDAWWRIRESGGTIYFDTAAATASNPPAGGDWTNRGSVTTATANLGSLDSMTVRLGARIIATQPSTRPAIVFDGLNIGAGLAYNMTSTETATVNHTQSVTGTYNVAWTEAFTPTDALRGGVVLTGALAETPALVDALLAGTGYFPTMAETATVADVQPIGGSLFTSDLADSSILDDTVAGRKQWENTPTTTNTWTGISTETTSWGSVDVRNPDPGWTTGPQ